MSKSAVFFDPHEDGMGCGEPKHYELTAYLQSIDGLHCPVDEVIADILRICPDATVADNGGYIRVGLGKHHKYSNGHRSREFNYRAICYMEAATEPPAGARP